MKQNVDLKIVSPQELDIARRLYCDISVIHNFFPSFNSILMVKDPRLLLNMDETMYNMKKSSK